MPCEKKRYTTSDFNIGLHVITNGNNFFRIENFIER